MTEKEVILLAIEKGYIRKKDALRLYNYIENGGKYICGICGYTLGKGAKKTIDHKIPISLGGTSDFDNLQLAHTSCNRKKANLVLIYENKKESI